jgi:hypothetical protein
MRRRTKSQLNPLFTGGVKSGGSSIDVHAHETYARRTLEKLGKTAMKSRVLRNICCWSL